MGLLDGNLDPQSMQTLALAGGLLSPGSFGMGLSRGIAGQQDAALKQQQIEDVRQQIILRNLQAQQQQRMFDLQTPFLEEAARRLRGGTAPVSASPSQPSIMAGAPGTIPPANSSSPVMGGTAPQPPQQPQGGSMFPGVPDSVAFGMIGTGGFSKIPDIISKYNEPTEFVKTLVAAGIDPGSAIGKQLIQNNIAKSNYVAPVNARPGSILRDPMDPSKVLAFNPNMPMGTSPSFDGQGNVTAINPIKNALALEQATSYAGASGKALAEPIEGYTAGNRPAFGNKLEAAGGNQLPNQYITGPGQKVVAPDAQLSAIRESLPLMLKELETATGPEKTALQRDINRAQNALLTGKPFSQSTTASGAASGPLMPRPALGAAATADASAKDAVENYNSMHSYATTSAPRAIGLLQGIEQLADKTLVGPGASKLQFVNGVLNSIGITPGADQAQNYQIMKKNLNMLVGAQRMGASGGGSDALQSLLEAANPNVAEMNGPAAKEAAQELIAYNRMMIAKDKTLPNPATSSAPAYQAAETAFAPFNDPRLWQLEHAQNDQERVRILSLVPATERATLLDKAKKARAAGVLN